jgi:hypothetical protein
VKTVLENPGLCLALMSWWIIPFLAASVLTHPISEYPRSYLLFLIALGGIVSFAGALNVINLRWQVWGKMGHWGKFLILSGCYTLSVAAILAVTLVLDSYGALDYFGGDAEGSFGMLFIPSVLGYFVLGGIACAVLSAHRTLRKKGKPLAGE